jgi:hypothetical protein
MKNKLSDLNNHLFAQLERLGEEDLTPEQIEKEAERAQAIVGIADQVIKTAAIQIQAARLMVDAGHGIDPTSHLPMIEGKVVAPKTLALTARTTKK